VTAVRANPLWRRLVPLATLLCVAAAVPMVIYAAGIGDAPQHHFTKRSVDGRRQLDLRYESSYQYEATFEKCEIQSIDQMARTFHVAATPTAVARAYARHHEPSTRAAVFHGCRDAYAGRWNPPKD
jgi:hypothetical protein